jgi:hypothetical protein
MKKQLNLLPFLSTDWEAGGSHKSVTPSSTNSSTLDWRYVHHGYLLGDSQLNPWNMQQYIIHWLSYIALVYVVSNRVGEPISKISLLVTSLRRSTKLLQQSRNVFSNQRMKKNEGYPWLPKRFLQQSKNEEEWMIPMAPKNILQQSKNEETMNDTHVSQKNSNRRRSRRMCLNSKWEESIQSRKFWDPYVYASSVQQSQT